MIEAQCVGIVNLWRAQEENYEADRITLPMEVDMIRYMSDIMFPNYRIGSLIEQSLVARLSEYLNTRYIHRAKLHHLLRTRDGMRWTVKRIS